MTVLSLSEAIKLRRLVLIFLCQNQWRFQKEFGTRHRAAIGLSENSDALTIVVSEETGGISITSKGEFLHDLTKENFEAILRTQLITEVEEEEHWYHKIWRKKQ